MNAQESLETIKHEVDEEGYCGYIEDELRVAMTALEKQIPKTTIWNTDEFFDYYFCPRCGTQLQQKARCVDIAYLAKSNYCHTCGQALNWEEIKNGKIK